MKAVLLAIAMSTMMMMGCGGPAPVPYKPIADTKVLMQSIVEPAAEVVWDAVGTIITLEGREEIQPASQEEWDTIRHQAVTLAEAGNLLMMPPRAQDGGDWMTLSSLLVDKGTEAIRAAEARDPERLFAVGSDIYDACNACHAKYSPAVGGRVSQ